MGVRVRVPCGMRTVGAACGGGSDEGVLLGILLPRHMQM